MSEEEKTRRENLAPGKQVFVYPEEFLPEEQKNLRQYRFQERKMESFDIPATNKEKTAMEKKTIYVHDDDAKLLQIVMFKLRKQRLQIYMRDLLHSNVFYKLHTMVKVEDVLNLSKLKMKELPTKNLPYFETDLDKILKSSE
eukprot:GHVP01029412.1.p1 GENE.GHVP01029412.1~~GHVP01029412.1.p1  ORF type:complete len:142 (+),score=18.91 GHVP01029412.1:177-602(+)